jgi:3-hydroxybutyrate dehydrogenase
VSAKHGVLGLVKTLALEGADAGIAAVAVCPGYVRTPLVERQIVDQAKAHGMPEEVAEAVAYLLGPGGRSMTGLPLTMDLGWTAR